MSENQLPYQKQEGQTGEDDSGGLKTGEEATRRSEQGPRISIEEEEPKSCAWWSHLTVEFNHYNSGTTEPGHQDHWF